MLSTIVKLLTWVKYKIYKRFYSYYIEVSDSVKSLVVKTVEIIEILYFFYCFDYLYILFNLAWLYVHLIHSTKDINLCLTYNKKI